MGNFNKIGFREVGLNLILTRQSSRQSRKQVKKREMCGLNRQGRIILTDIYNNKF